MSRIFQYQDYSTGMSFYMRERVVKAKIYLILYQHNPSTGLDGTNFTMFIHGNYKEAIHYTFLALTWIHQ